MVLFTERTGTTAFRFKFALLISSNSAYMKSACYAVSALIDIDAAFSHLSPHGFAVSSSISAMPYSLATPVRSRGTGRVTCQNTTACAPSCSCAPPRRARNRPRPGKTCVANVRAGFSNQVRGQLQALLISRQRPKPVVACRHRALWVEPSLFCQVRFLEWTQAGRLRGASFLGLLSDPCSTVCVGSGPASIFKTSLTGRAD